MSKKPPTIPCGSQKTAIYRRDYPATTGEGVKGNADVQQRSRTADFGHQGRLSPLVPPQLANGVRGRHLHLLLQSQRLAS